MPGAFDDAVRADIGELSARLARRTPDAAALRPQEWLGVVQTHSARLIAACRDVPEDAWATHSAAVAYALEAAMESGIVTPHEHAVRRLHLTAALLRRVPADPRVDLLDPDRAIGLLLRSLPVGLERARERAPVWRTLDIAEIRLLRRAKNLLHPALDIVATVGRGDLDARLAAWRDVLPRLP
ncbi:hypothetical protein ACFO4E_09060 [Nocardiopsis mangrovi]|uniref:Uncharacterized protein n=1 Tax=Nocardiopsis mangrovi TaxID=1179818 RepID=A0ABV9DUB6_9ACTN